MKKIAFFAALAALITLASCQKEEPVGNNEYPDFTATIDTLGTKTSIDMETGKIGWVVGDVITVSDGSKSAEYKYQYYKSDSSATVLNMLGFKIKDNNQPVLGDGPYTATYGSEPSTSQTYYSNHSKISQLKLYMTAPSTTTNNLTFTVQCGLMRLNLTKPGERVKSVAVTGTPTGGSQTTYTLTCDTPESIESATDLYIALPAGNYNRIVITNNDGLICTLNASSPLTISKNQIRPVTIEASKINFRIDDLGMKGTANCYLVSQPGNYTFNASVKGGSTESVGTPASAEVLWESFGTDVTPAKGDIINNSVSLESGYVKFSTPSILNNGNAVIAVKDTSGTILWSWHIWVCKDFDPVASAHVYKNNAGTMMDRNLGATSAAKGDVHALGLLYQWGRKDPFMSGCQIFDSKWENQQIAASTLSWPSATPSDASNGTIAYAVANPTTFITGNSYNEDWYYTGATSADNTRWQTSKTMYDPCPAGWRVPDDGEEGVWAKAFGSSSYRNNGPWDSTNYGMNFGSDNGKPIIMQLGDASIIWYPAAGYRRKEDGLLNDVGWYVSYWSCTPFDNIYMQYLFCFSDGFLKPIDGGGRAYAQSVRCMKE